MVGAKIGEQNGHSVRLQEDGLTLFKRSLVLLGI